MKSDFAGAWHIKLFNKSVLKQRKLKEILQLLGHYEGKTCLDLGSDNGVISYYLRQGGGSWYSADLSETAVKSIESLVAQNVRLVSGMELPYPDSFFDIVVVVDMLEHVEDDKRFAAELARVLKIDGVLIVNAPNLKPFSPLRAFRHLIGQTDEAHGHLRPGYGETELRELFEKNFRILSSKTYSRFFSEFIDTAIVFAYSLLQKLSKSKESGSDADASDSSKGLLLTQKDMKKFEKSFRLYSVIYPIVSAVSKLDCLIGFIPGFMRITAAKRVKT